MKALTVHFERNTAPPERALSLAFIGYINAQFCV